MEFNSFNFVAIRFQNAPCLRFEWLGIHCCSALWHCHYHFHFHFTLATRYVLFMCGWSHLWIITHNILQIKIKIKFAWFDSHSMILYLVVSIHFLFIRLSISREEFVSSHGLMFQDQKKDCVHVYFFSLSLLFCSIDKAREKKMKEITVSISFTGLSRLRCRKMNEFDENSSCFFLCATRVMHRLWMWFNI